MIVELRTLSQAARVAAVTGGRHLPADKPGKLSRRVDIGAGFQKHRGAVESVSVLFRLFDENGVEVPSGWTVSAAKFEVCWPADPGLVRSHFGGRRFAFHWALGQVKADMDARKGGSWAREHRLGPSVVAQAVEPGQRRGRPVVGGQLQGGLLGGDRRSGPGPGQLEGVQSRHADGQEHRLPGVPLSPPRP